MEGIIACVAILPADSARLFGVQVLGAVSVLLADNIELPLSAHSTQSKLWGINSARTGVELKADSFCLTKGNLSISLCVAVAPDKVSKRTRMKSDH
jgi:hypothetical protein